MTTRKLLLNYLLDLGGVATLNNLYSRSAKSPKGAILHTRNLFRFYLANALIERIEPLGKPMNKSREVFYCLTKRGASYIGRPDEYKYKKYIKSPNNTMHESAKYDIALTFLKQYPGVNLSFMYHKSFYGVRPDITVKIEQGKETRYFLLELERKKTISRVYKEKIIPYENMFKSMLEKKSHNISRYTVLFVYTDIFYNVFLRPQEYDQNVINHAEQVNYKLRRLIKNYCRYLPDHRYRFTGFHNFDRLHEPIWLTPAGNRVGLVV